MSIPTLTLRSIRNKDTGIDLASPSVQEVEAPLGGTSVEYEILVVTRLPLFKTQLHKNEDVVHFSVYKAYREVEDLHSKLQKKYCLKDLPSIPKQRQILSTSTEEKRLAIDGFVSYIAKSELLSSSSIFIQFLGINPQKQRSLSNAGPVEDVVSASDKKLSDETEQSGEEGKKTRALSEVLWPENKEKPSLSIGGNIDLFMSAEPASTENTVDKNEEEENADDLFLKVKDYKQKNQHPLSEENVNNEKKVTVHVSQNSGTTDDDVDLFEEVQRMKERESEKTGADLFDTKKKTHHGLFDGIDDGGSTFFGINVSSKGSDVLTPQSSSSDSDTKSEISIGKSSSIEILPASRSITEKPSVDFTDSRSDVPLISKQHKLGEVSLFQEQDFGDSITVDEEPLFLVSQTKEKVIRKNPLLSPKTAAAAARNVEDTEGNENLDDLLNLAPLPSVPQTTKQALFPETLEDRTVISKHKSNSQQKSDLFSESSDSLKHQVLKPEVEGRNKIVKPEASKQSSDARPEPVDRSKAVQQLTSGTKTMELKEVQPERPVPMPRSRPPPPKPKEKPQVLPRRVSLGKPTLPPKPVPPPKPKPPGIAQKPSENVPKPLDSSKSSSTKVQRKTNDAAGELNSFDILQYIEQEEKSSLTEASLFD